MSVTVDFWSRLSFFTRNKHPNKQTHALEFVVTVVAMSFNLPLDPKFTAVINRRRIAEEARRARIFNPRQRLIGVDIDALNDQVHSSKFAKELEKEKERAHAEYLKQCDHTALLLQQQEEQEIVSREQAIDHFRKTEQRKEDGRDFDLYDPDLKKKELPARVSDDDSRCSLSGVQKLEGEDLDYKERTKVQKQQYAQWLMEQVAEKRMQADQLNADIIEAELKLNQLDDHALHLAQREKEHRKEKAKDFNRQNLHLAQEQREKARQQEMHEDLNKMNDIYHNFYGDFLSENPEAARSSFGAHRVVPDRWKGMSKEECLRYYHDQRDQIVENMHCKEKELQENMEWQQLQISEARQAQLLERSEARTQKQLNLDLLRQNKELSRDQSIQHRFLKDVVYTNRPTEEYFSQFNTTTR